MRGYALIDSDGPPVISEVTIAVGIPPYALSGQDLCDVRPVANCYHLSAVWWNCNRKSSLRRSQTSVIRGDCGPRRLLPWAPL